MNPLLRIEAKVSEGKGWSIDKWVRIDIRDPEGTGHVFDALTMYARLHGLELPKLLRHEDWVEMKREDL